MTDHVEQRTKQIANRNVHFLLFCDGGKFCWLAVILRKSGEMPATFDSGAWHDDKEEAFEAVVRQVEAYLTGSG